MMNTNTTRSIGRASTVLGDKCRETKANMKKLMAGAGCAEYKTVRTMIPRLAAGGDDVVFVGLNGVKMYFLRGESVDMPEPVAAILANAKIL